MNYFVTQTRTKWKTSRDLHQEENFWRERDGEREKIIEILVFS